MPPRLNQHPPCPPPLPDTPVGSPPTAHSCLTSPSASPDWSSGQGMCQTLSQSPRWGGGVCAGMSLYASAWVCMCTYGCLGMCVHVSVTDRDLGVQGRDSRGQVRSPSRLANSASPCPLRSWADSQAFSLCPPPCPAGWTGSWGPAALPATHGLFSVPPLGRPPCRPPSQPGAPGPTQPEGEEFPESRDCGPHLGDISSKGPRGQSREW